MYTYSLGGSTGGRSNFPYINLVGTGSIFKIISFTFINLFLPSININNLKQPLTESFETNVPKNYQKTQAGPQQDIAN